MQSDSANSSTSDGSEESSPRKTNKRLKRPNVRIIVPEKKPADGEQSIAGKQGDMASHSHTSNASNPTAAGLKKDGSVVWDIELGRSIDDVSETSSVSKAPKESTIILDTRARQWTAVDMKGPSVHVLGFNS